ncbi:hypothetical protein DAPPUDRAFT_112189 [Daphnia pulex]|uniref:Uncharacterized protein n=1 Tax=Daphnia pulex TaxID=6669 RepID=E9HB88_DAPPU|nr:hypothetical protein DAPPUDRAFT_112189 [Daphnia pulex]|eukprot:EFX70993.1 hypothetical protein DAPPUDRAFT_112189 [Daphnia pulex]
MQCNIKLFELFKSSVLQRRTVAGPPGADSTVAGSPGADSTVVGLPGGDSTLVGPLNVETPKFLNAIEVKQLLLGVSHASSKNIRILQNSNGDAYETKSSGSKKQVVERNSAGQYLNYLLDIMGYMLPNCLP